MKKTITIFTIVLLILFMVGCENSSNPIITENQTESFVQSENAAKISALPFGGERSGIVAKKGPKGPKPPKPNKWRVPEDFATIQLAIDAIEVLDGDKIEVGEGNFYGAFVTKKVEIKGKKGKKGKKGEGNKTIINDGPVLVYGLTQGFRFFDGSDGSKIKDITFTTDFGIMNNDGSDNIKISHCKFLNTIQGISAWGGSGWKIDHNEIIDLRTYNGGGIGILSGARWGGIVEKNDIKHNKISGTLHVWANDGGGYAGSGIVLFADTRYGWPGADAIQYNKVERNKVSLISDTPSVVDVVGCELTDSRDDESIIIIFENKIKGNDFRGTANAIALTPEALIDHNDISKNKVD